MNNIFLIVFFVLSFPAMAINPHEGGGGNVCRVSRWKVVLVDEFASSKTKLEAPGPNMDRYQFLIKNKQFKSPHNLVTVDLTATDVAKRALRKIRFLKKVSRELALDLEDLFLTMKFVYKKDDFFDRTYDMDNHPRVKDGCIPGTERAAIVSDRSGAIVISEAYWKKLTNGRKTLLLIHETLRLAQIHMPWFSKVTSEQISELTMMIFRGDLYRLQTSRVMEDSVDELDRLRHVRYSQATLQVMIESSQEDLNRYLDEGNIQALMKEVSRLSMLKKQVRHSYRYRPQFSFSEILNSLKADSRYLELIEPSILTDYQF